jgi:hypothetical protein
MLKLQYKDGNFYSLALAAIERQESLEVSITGLHAWIIKKARPQMGLLLDDPTPLMQSKKALLSIPKTLLMYFYPTPTFWGVRFLATRAGMKESWTESDGILTVTFQSSKESAASIAK